jgi:uncharacterized protein YegP (UPF0339 family)
MRRTVLWTLYKDGNLGASKVAEVYEATLRGQPVFRFTIFGANGKKMADGESYPTVRNAKRGVDDLISRLTHDASHNYPFSWREVTA